MSSKITPQQITGLRNALYTVERIPLITLGACCEFGLKFCVDTEEYSEMKYIVFRITENIFKIYQGGTVYDKSIGGDSYSGPDWIIETGGYKNTKADLLDIESTIKEYILRGARIIVYDESDIEYEEEKGQ
jgi:hypothetical protein